MQISNNIRLIIDTFLNLGVVSYSFSYATLSYTYILFLFNTIRLSGKKDTPESKILSENITIWGEDGQEKGKLLKGIYVKPIDYYDRKFFDSNLSKNKNIYKVHINLFFTGGEFKCKDIDFSSIAIYKAKKIVIANQW